MVEKHILNKPKLERTTIYQKRQTKKLMKNLDKKLDRIKNSLSEIIETEIVEFRNSIKECEQCGTSYIEMRTGCSSFCCDNCRTDHNRGLPKEKSEECDRLDQIEDIILSTEAQGVVIKEKIAWSHNDALNEIMKLIKYK